MPTNKNRRSRRVNRRRTNNRSETSVLRDIREELRNEYTQLPRVRDVMPMTLARYRTFVFALTWDVATMTTSTSSTVNFGYYAALSALPGYSSLQDVFDQYRMLQVVYNFVPLSDPSVGGVSGSIYSAIDYEDANVPASHQDLEQYDTCMVTTFGKRFMRVVNPSVSLAAYASGVFTSYAVKKNQWIDCSSPSVQHYGIKVSIPAFGTIAYQMQLKGTCYVQMRSQI